MLKKLKAWWALDLEAEKNSADNPLTALSNEQRRSTGPLLALAFGWGFLVTGLFTGSQLGNGIPFWPDIILSTFLGNLANFIVGAIVGWNLYTGSSTNLQVLITILKNYMKLELY